MKSRAVRLALFVLVVLAFAGAGYELVTVDRQVTAARRAATVFGDTARDVESAIGELRSSTFAYVAMGQGRAFWSERASTLLQTIGSDLQKLQLIASSSEARASLVGAAEALTTVQRFDENIRKYLDEEQVLLASDLIFSDLREAMRTAGARVADARQREESALASGLDSQAKLEAGTVAGAALFALLVLALLVPRARADLASQVTSEVAAATPPGPAEAAVDSFRPEVRPARPEAPSPAPDEPVRAPDVNLAAAATLCTDFARLKENSELAGLLARAADLLDAAGIIVWVADPASGELRPAASHGYSALALGHIHAIRKDEDNATATAFREGALRVVEANGLSNGAVAAPLLTPDGCVGVIAAEIRRGRERRPGIQAMATILAAQLSTLVNSPTGTESS